MAGIFSNRRVVAIILLVAAVLILLCSFLANFANPKFNDIGTATKAVASQIARTATVSSQQQAEAAAEESSKQTQVAEEENSRQAQVAADESSRQTQVADEEENRQTQTAEQTAVSYSLTQTAIPTATTTPTPPPQRLDGCHGTPVQQKTTLYLEPSLGAGEIASDATDVTILAEAENISWYKIETVDEYSWIRKDAVSLEDECQPSTEPLSYIAGWGEDKVTELDDTFDTANSWVNESGQFIPPVPVGDSKVLELKGSQDSPAMMVNQPFGHLEQFSLYTSFSREYNGYFGIRFWDDDAGRYYEVGVDYNCMISVFDSGNPIVESQIETDRKCISGTVNFLSINMLEDNELSVRLNDAAPLIVLLPEEYSGERLKLITSKSVIIGVEYLVITSNR